jgi:hypothetical protein
MINPNTENEENDGYIILYKVNNENIKNEIDKKKLLHEETNKNKKEDKIDEEEEEEFSKEEKIFKNNLAINKNKQFFIEIKDEKNDFINFECKIDLYFKKKSYNFNLKDSKIFFDRNNYNFFILTRPSIDNRRFISSLNRLDTEILFVDLIEKKIKWSVIQECFYDTDDDYSESGVDIKIYDQFLICRTFVYNGFEGNSTLNFYNIKNGEIIYCYSNTKGEINGEMRNQQDSELITSNDKIQIKNDQKRKNSVKKLKNDNEQILKKQSSSVDINHKKESNLNATNNSEKKKSWNFGNIFTKKN